MPPSADAVSASSALPSVSPSSPSPPSGAAAVAAVTHAASLLTSRGVAAAVAQRLAWQYGAARVLEVVGAFDAGRGKGPGWLVAALERGYGTGSPSTPFGAATGGGSGTGGQTDGGDLLTHAAALAELSARGVVLDQLHPMTNYLDVVPQADGMVRFRLKASVPPAAFRRRL